MKKSKQSDHVTVKIPRDLIGEMDKLIGSLGFRSRGEIAKEAIRQLLNHYKESLASTEQPKFEHFNTSENGVRILDRTLANGISKGRIIDVYFKPEGVWCDYCQTNSCRHIQFALTVPAIQKVVLKKREEGWKLPQIIE
jgi:Arc/MetJ-type ribon-helix-helix transcriptional regulator